MRKLQKTIIAASLSFIIAGTAGSLRPAAKAADIQLDPITETNVQESNIQKVVTEYSDLWTGVVTFKTGEPVQWYVHVPEDTVPKGCGATIKIPGLGWGTEAHNKEEGHITLVQGDNLVYEFTPEEAGDYIFTCWMGSGCHSNYIHVTVDGKYTAEKPSDPTNIRAERKDDTISVSFDAPDAPEGARITGYKVFAADKDGKRTKKIVQENSVKFENLNAESSYTIKVYTLATSGTSDGSNETIVEAVSEPTAEEPTDTSQDENQNETQEQVIITEYDDLWTGNITVKQGVPVKWYVNVPEGTEPKGCAATIKIPGLGFGTDSNDKNEDHVSLTTGKNFVYEFTPQETGDILFTCWMGSGCHYNYIHVTADGTPDSDAKTGGRGTNTSNVATTSADKKNVKNTTTTSKVKSSENNAPKTGDAGCTGAELLLVLSLGTALVLKKNRRDI